MNLNFATYDKANATRFFAAKGYDWLNDEAKEYVLNNLCDGLRVQDPMMHPRSSLVITDMEHHSKIVKLMEEAPDEAD